MFVALTVWQFGPDEHWDAVDDITCGQLSRALEEYNRVLVGMISLHHVPYQVCAYEDVLMVCILSMRDFFPDVHPNVPAQFPVMQKQTGPLTQIANDMKQIW